MKTLVALLIAIVGHRSGINTERVSTIVAESREVAVEHGGPFASVEENQAAVLAVMANESGLDARIERCESPWPGANDSDTSWGLGQVKVSWLTRIGLGRDSVCADRKLQIRAALYVLSLYRGMSPQRVFQGYNTGNPHLTTGTSKRTLRDYERIRSALLSETSSPVFVETR